MNDQKTPTNPLTSASPHPSPIGRVVGGGLKENLRVRLNIPAQEVQEGAFVVIESGEWLFYGLVIDLSLGATDPRFADEQSEDRLPSELAGLLHGETLFNDLGQVKDIIGGSILSGHGSPLKKRQIIADQNIINRLSGQDY